MKGLYKLLPAKRLTLIQNLVSVILLAVIVFMSFGTVFTAHIEKNETTTDMFDSIVNSFGDGEAAEMPETVEVSAPYIIKSLGSLGKILKSGMDAIKNATELAGDAQKVQDDINNFDSDPDSLDDLQNNADNLGNLENSASDLENKANKTKDSVNELGESLKSEEFISLISLIVVIAQGFSTNFVLGLVYFALIALAIILPVIATIRFIIALVSLIKNLGNPGKAYTTITKSVGGIFVLFPTLWLFKIIAPQVEFAKNITTMVALLIVIMVMNLVASRLKCYTPAQFKYVNVLQAVSVFSVVGFFLFMMNIDGMHFFDHLWDRMDVFAKTAKGGDIALVSLIVLVTVLLLFFLVKFIKKLAFRLCCMVPTGKVLAHDSYLVTAIFGVGLIAAPMFLMKGKFGLDLGDDMKSFTVFSVGIVLMLVCEIVLPILKKTVCASATADDIHAVLVGCPTGTPDEAPVEEAPVEESPVEEAPVEEAPVEEAPVEEVPVEEAPVEEAPTEETAAEEAPEEKDQAEV